MEKTTKTKLKFKRRIRKRTPIAKGVFNGVKWQSLTTIESIRVSQIKHITKEANRKLKAFGVEKTMSAAESIYFYQNQSVHEFINQKLDRLEFYKSFGKYKNNKTT